MDSLQQIPLTLCVFKATLAAGTTSTLSNTGTINYAIKGKAYQKTAMTNAATPTTDSTTGAAFVPITTSMGAVIVICLDSAAALKACQGPLQALDSAGAFINAPAFPMVPDTLCPIGYEVIKAGSTASAAGWVFGTNNQASVTGITYTLVDVMTLPERPQIA